MAFHPSDWNEEGSNTGTEEPNPPTTTPVYICRSAFTYYNEREISVYNERPTQGWWAEGGLLWTRFKLRLLYLLVGSNDLELMSDV